MRVHVPHTLPRRYGSSGPVSPTHSSGGGGLMSGLQKRRTHGKSYEEGCDFTVRRESHAVC